MIRFSADWILPISDAPIGRGVVAIDEGRIVSVETGGSAADVALGRVAILPGLVNAHAHLELSYLHRRIPPAERFLDWVRPMLAARRGGLAGRTFSEAPARKVFGRLVRLERR